MEKQYCKFGEDNNCPYLEGCFEKRLVPQHVHVGFESLPKDHLEGKEVKAWYKKVGSESTKIHCIERIFNR